MKKLLKSISIVLIIANLLMVPFSSNAASGTTDTTSDSALLSKWKGYGLLNASITDSDLSKPITKIDFIRYINDILKPSKQVDIGFSDVPKNSWYGAEIAKAVAAGYVTNQDKTNYNPFDNITRLDAAVMVAHVFELELKDKNSINRITDAEKLDTYQLASLGAVIEKGYLSEISAGRYAPSGVLKLIDAIQMLDKCFGQLVTKSIKINSDVPGNILINTSGVTLEDITVKGDLIIGEGVADGEVRLEDTILKGRLIVRGGGSNSIVLINTQVKDNLIVEKSAGDVHVELFGTSVIEQTYLKSGCLLSEKNISGKGFVNVTANQATIKNQIANLQGDFNNIIVDGSNINVKLIGNAQNIDISKDTEGSFSVNGNVETITTQAVQTTLELLGGTISKLNVEAGAKGNKIIINGAKTNAVKIAAINLKENTAVNIDKGTIDELTIESSAEGSNLELKTGAILKNLFAKASANITGKGQITNAYVYSKNVSMGIKPSGKYLTDNSATDTGETVADSNSSLIKIYGKDITIQNGKTEKVTAYVIPTSSTLSYSSLDSTIATVDDKGILTAKSVGTTSVNISAQKEGYTSNVATISVTVTSDNFTLPGALEISPANGEAGTYEDFILTYTAGENMSNGKVYIRLPIGFVAVESDLVKIGDFAERALGSSWQKPDTLLFENLNLKQGQKIVVKLMHKIVPEGGRYEFSAISDADATGPKLPTSGEEKTIFISDNLRILKLTTNYSEPEYGSKAGTTKISTLSFAGLGDYITDGYNWLVKVQDGEFTVPKFNDVLPVSATEYLGYKQGDDIAVVAGQHLILAAVDASNKIKAYADIIITDGTNGSTNMIRPDDAEELVAGTNYNVPVSGIMAGTVSIGGLNYDGADHWMIRVQDTALSTVFINTPFTGAKDYNTDDDIKVNVNQHIILAAVDSSNKILAYADIQVDDNMIGKEAGKLEAGINYKEPEYGSLEGTTKISWMKKGDANGGFPNIDHWMIVVLNKEAVIPAKNASVTKYQIYTKDADGTEHPFSVYSDTEGRDITVALGQHLILVGVDAENRIQAYADIKINSDAVRKADAPTIPVTNFEAPIMGSKEYTTKIPTLDFDTAIPGATKYMVKVQDSALVAAPQLNSTLPGILLDNYKANQDIKITAGQHLILIAADADGKVKAYQDFEVKDEQIRPKDALKLNVSSKDYVPGTENGTTSINLASTGFTKWMYSISNTPFDIPYDGSDITGSMTEKDYKSGGNIPISIGQYILIIAVDSNGKTLAYTQDRIEKTQILQAKAIEIPDGNCSTPVAGLAKDTTRIMSLSFQGINGADKWLYKISSSKIDAPDYNSVVSGLTTYVEGANIVITKGQYIILYAVDNLTDRRIKAYKNIQVTKDEQIKTEVATLRAGYNYLTPVQGSASGTTVIPSLSFVDLVGQDAATWSWRYAVGDKVFIAPAKNTTIDTIGFATEEYIFDTTNNKYPNISVKSGQFILLLAVDGSGVIQGYANIPVLPTYIKPADADIIKPSNYSLIQGTTEGTTRFDILNRVGLSSEATKWMIKTQSGGFTTPIGKDTKVTGAYDYSDNIKPDIRISEGEHILLLATDNSGYVKAYIDITVAKAQIKNPFALDLSGFVNTNYVGPQKGTSPGTTMITLKDTGIPTDDVVAWKYKIGATSFSTPHLDDDASGTEYTAYTSNENIPISVNSYLLVVAVNKNDNKIKAYLQFKITSDKVMPANAGALTEGVNYTTPVPGSDPGTTKIGYLSFIGLPSDVDHWVIKVVDAEQTISINSNIPYPTTYAGGNISVKAGQFVLLAAVDKDDRVKAYANIAITDGQINPPLAPDIASMNYSGPYAGTAKGTTALKVSPDDVTYVLKVANAGEYITYGQVISVSTTIQGTDYSAFRKYVSNTNITATAGQVIILVEIDGDSKAVAYKNIPINSAVNPGLATELILNKNYLDLQPGPVAGTTIISGLDFVGIAVGDTSTAKWAVKVDNSEPAKPLMNSSILGVEFYTGKTIEVKVVQGQVLQLYALDASGYVKGYAFITVGTDDVKGVATRISPVPVPGSSLNTTKLQASVLDSLLTSISGATKWKYAVLDSSPADILKDTKLTWVSPYTNDADILAAENKHLVLVATDADDLVKAYADITLDSSMLKSINATITGTITDSTGESDIVAGGKTIIITLDSGEWVDDIENKTSVLFAGFTPTVADTQWKNVTAGFNIVPTADKKAITIRLSECKYDITTNRQISLKIDKSLIKNADKDVIIANAFTIGADVTIKALTGTAITSGITKDDIISGGKTIIVELSVGEFTTDIDIDADKRNAIFNGLNTANSDKTVRNQIVEALKGAGTSAIKWNSKTKLTITLPAIPGFTLAANEVFSLTIPCKAAGKEIFVGAVKDAIAPTQIIVSANTSASLSGTLISAPVSETDIANGGKTLLITLTGGQWVTNIETNDTIRNALFAGLTVAPVVSSTETAKWTKVITALQDAAKLAGQTVIKRTSNDVLTIKLPTVLGYDITANQTITVNIPKDCIIGGIGKVTAEKSFVIERLVKASLTGTVGGATESDIRTGGKNIVITLEDATWVDGVGVDDKIKNALLDGLVADSENDTAWKLVIGKIKSTTGSVVKTSAKVVTITLPAVDTYEIAANQKITVTIPASAIMATSFDTKATGTLTIANTLIPAVVSKVYAATPNTKYKIGETVTIYVAFDKEVQVSGTTKPSIKLTNGKTATYVSGTGSKVLTFTYTVQTGDESQYLNYPESTSILNGTIVNAGTTTSVTRTLPSPQTDSSLGATDIYIDGVIPVFTTGYPKAGDLTNIEANFLAQADEEGTLFYVVLPKSAAAPSTTQVVAKQDSKGILATLSGEVNVLLNSEAKLKVTGLTEYTDYNIYMAIKDTVGNISELKTMPFKTLDFTKPTFVKAPVMGTISNNKIDIVMSTSEDTTIRMIALPVGSAIPTSEQVWEFKDANGTVVTAANLKVTQDLKKNIETTVSFTGLSVSSHYDVYVVCEDASKNLIAEPKKVSDVKTSKLILDNVGVNVAKKLITNTTTAMQYSYNEYTWYDCSALNTTLKYDDTTDYLKVYIREAADKTNIKIIPIISRGDSTLFDIAKIGYDIGAKKIINRNTVSVSDTTALSLEYSMNGGIWRALNAEATNVEFEAGDLYIRLAATNTELPSIYKTIKIPLPMEAPNLVMDDYKNTIMGLESTYEYRISSGTVVGEWTNGSVVGDFSGTKKVEVRKAATVDKLPSAIQTLNFTACVIKVVASPAADDDTINKAYVTITFEENTNVPTFTPEQFKTYFSVGTWDNTNPTSPKWVPSVWGTDINSVKWTAGNVLTIAFKSMTGSTVKIGGEVKINALAGIKKYGATNTDSSYTSTGSLTGSFHSVPKLSVKAVNSDGKIGFGNGDKIVITFDQLTNEPAITAANIDTYLKVTGKRWGVVANNDIVWSKSTDNMKSILTITFNNVANTSVRVNDKISINPLWGLKDVDETTAACNSNVFIGGSFTSIPEIVKVVYAGNTVTIRFNQATNASKIAPNELNDFLKLKGTDGKPHSWGLKNDQTISWNADGSILTIKLNSTEGRTIAVGDTLTLVTLAEIKDVDNTTLASSDSAKVE